MYILAIDTAANLCSLSIWNGTQKIQNLERELKQGHAAILAPLCKELLSKCNLSLQKIDQILVNVGPGSFTGIRVGMAFAKGLATSANIPLSGINAFDAAYWGQTKQNPNTLIILDARRKDYYCQYISSTETQPPLSMTMKEISDFIKQYRPILIGNGVPILEGQFETTPTKWHGADALVNAFQQGFAQKAAPYYLREPDVTLKAC